MTSYIVIVQSIVGGDEREMSTVYNWDGRHHLSIDAAVDAGWKTFDHDDFNVGRVEDGKLVWFGWEHEEMGDIVRLHDDQEARVVAARPAGKNFIDVQFEDGQVWYLIGSYEIVQRAQHPAVSDVVASAHLSGVDLPADHVANVLRPLARGEVTADDAVQALVDSSLRDRIATEFIRHLYWNPGTCECGWKVDEAGDVDWQTQFRAHVAQSIVDSSVAPMLAERDRRLALAEAALEPDLNAFADLVETRQLLRQRNKAYGQASATIGELRGQLARRDYLPGAAGERLRQASHHISYWQSLYTKTRAELEKLRAELQRERESRQAWQEKLAEHEFKLSDALGIVGAEEGIDPYEAVVALHTEIDRLRAELDAVKSKRMWRTAPISGVMHLVPDGDGRRESVCGLVGSTTWQPAVDGNARCLECERWKPDTEAAGQAASSTVVDVVLYPPVGWLNRVDEVLRYHGAADRDGSAVGEALGTLIRSWRDEQARHSPDCGPEEWGPREATVQAPDPVDTIIQRAVVRCADMDGVPYEECDRERQDRYRDYVTATLAELPMDVLGQLSPLTEVVGDGTQ
jgi:uncharacterized small protein (DUF1192 family)